MERNTLNHLYLLHWGVPHSIRRYVIVIDKLEVNNRLQR